MPGKLITEIAGLSGSSATCPYCDGLGGHPVSKPFCCGNAEWECGASGCTGPIEQSELECCEACHGTGALPEAPHD